MLVYVNNRLQPRTWTVYHAISTFRNMYLKCPFVYEVSYDRIGGMRGAISTSYLKEDGSTLTLNNKRVASSKIIYLQKITTI